jgi:dihydrofolate synthase/folylpolyglutamate synthase
MSPAPIEIIPHDYQTALELLYGRINYEKNIATKYNSQNYRLDRMREILLHLDNPHTKYPVIHVAGTKGKGTTSTVLHDALRANHLNVGLYTSPHLVRLEERFRLNGRECSPSELVELTQQVYEAVRRVEQDGWGNPTFFEMTTAIGFLYFQRRQADCVVLEVGMGGRLDSTNVCQPLLCIITSISMDHQAQLGDTIELIAREKAGIIKNAVPVICTARSQEARNVIQEVAGENNSPLFLIDRDFKVHWSPMDQFRRSTVQNSSNAIAEVHYQSSHSNLRGIFADSPWNTCMLGRHQAENLAGVITALAWLSQQAGWTIDLQKTQQAVLESHAEARLQIIGDDPIQIIDTAHNPASVQAGLQALDDHFPHHPRTIVFACSRDKEYRTMLKQILPKCNHLICTSFLTNPRAVASDSLRSTAMELIEQLQLENINSAQIESIDRPEEAWNQAVNGVDNGRLIMAVGSFFLAAELLAMRKQVH